MAIRLSKVLVRWSQTGLRPSPQSWLLMQMNYDLWQAEQEQPHQDLQMLELVQ